jgi:hypothetical protein
MLKVSIEVLRAISIPTKNFLGLIQACTSLKSLKVTRLTSYCMMDQVANRSSKIVLVIQMGGDTQTHIFAYPYEILR